MVTMQANLEETFPVQFESGPLAVRSALAEILTGLSALKLEQEELGTVELVLAEALNNVVEHAYPEGSPAGPVDVNCMHRSNGLHFTVIDEGLPMPGGQLPLGLQANIDVDMIDLPEGGFGWFLIQDLAKDVVYQRKGERNVLDLRLAVAVEA